MNKRIVTKFGGSNLTSPQAILRVLNTIEGYNQPIIIVVSAFKGVTDQLISGMNLHSNESIEQLIEQLRFKHSEAVRLIIDNKDKRKLILNRLNRCLIELLTHLQGYHQQESLAQKDLILSYGERLSALLLSEFLNFRGLKACECKPETMGLVTNGIFQNASINLPATQRNIRRKKIFHLNQIFVIPGFYGVSNSGQVTILGRGGSDYTASSIAYCIDADYLDLWKDVDGILSADPRIISENQIVRSMNFREAEQLAYWGAKILHPKVFEPLKEKKIEVRLFNIFSQTLDMKPASVVSCQENSFKDDSPKSIVLNEDYAWLEIRGTNLKIIELKNYLKQIFPEKKEMIHVRNLSKSSIGIVVLSSRLNQLIE